jgi:hypothetical protein
MKIGDICAMIIAGRTETMNAPKIYKELEYARAGNCVLTLYCRSRTEFPSCRRVKDVKRAMKT